MPLELFTIQMGKWRLARDRGIMFLDTTVKSGDRIFAPQWDMVLGHKNGTVSDEEYTQRYRRLMIDSWVNNRDRWMTLLQSNDQVALACYCPAGQFCHRHLLRGILEELGGKLNLPVRYYGELTD